MQMKLYSFWNTKDSKEELIGIFPGGELDTVKEFFTDLQQHHVEILPYVGSKSLDKVGFKDPALISTYHEWYGLKYGTSE